MWHIRLYISVDEFSQIKYFVSAAFQAPEGDAIPQEWLLTQSSLGWELDLGEKLVMNLHLKKGKWLSYALKQ